MKTSVRQIVIVATVVLSAVAVSSIGFATYFGRFLNDASGVAVESLNSVHATGELQKYLRAYSRQNFIFDVSGGTRYQRRRLDSEEQIRSWLQKVRERSENATDQALIESISSEIDEFLAKEKEVGGESKNSLTNFMNDSAKMRMLEENLEKLASARLSSAESMRKRVLDRTQIVNMYGLASGVVVTVVCLGLIAWLRRFFYRPIRSLAQTLEKFGRGDRRIRAIDSARMPAEIGELAMRFNDMAEALEEQRATQLRFLSAVAHDLRNPLSGISMASGLLQDGGQSIEDRKTYSAIISRQAANMDRMVGDLLDTTRIEAGQLDLRMQNEDVIALVEDTINLYQGTSQTHVIKLSRPSHPVYAFCDGARIGQVLNNLVSNALKYSPYGGTINLDVSEEVMDVVIAIRDEGMGISPQDLESIFEPFRRSKATREAIPGIGLGLSVARRIIEGHNGKIIAESTNGRGPKFTIRLPLSDNERRASAKVADTSANEDAPKRSNDQLSLH